MVPKKPKSLKQNLQDGSHVQVKRPNQAPGTSSEEEEEGASEMERNFALFSKRGLGSKPELIETDEEEMSGEESDDDDREHGQAESTDPSGSGGSHHQRDRRQNDTNGSLHTKTHQGDLSTMSFEEIMKLQSKVGTKACKKFIHEAKRTKQNSHPETRVTRDRPQEISAKKPVSFLRNVGCVKKPILRDPRFDDLSGEFKPQVFSQTYKFINDIRQREAEMVKKKLKKVKSEAKKEELKSFLKRMESQKRNHQRQEQQREKELCYKRKQRALVGEGHKPFYLKKSDKKKLQLAEKYSELRRSGKLENFLSKKRKRNAVKDRRKLP